MRTIVLLAALAAAPLAGCVTFGDALPVPQVGQGPISSGAGLAGKVVRGAQSACGYRPTVGTAAAVLAGILVEETGLSDAGTTEAIVNAAEDAICAGVSPLASGPNQLSNAGTGRAYGVRIRGRFVGGRHVR